MPALEDEIEKPFEQIQVNPGLHMQGSIMGQHASGCSQQGAKGIQGENMVGDDQAAVAFRAPAAEPPLLDDDDLPPFIHQEVGNESADNTTTDNDNSILFHSWLDKPQRSECHEGERC